ncbi:heme ABC transporter ATP-binding protein [Belliella sp. DSM 111904]|uniref:Heme ABC transporter ATP-binding protein n=1 Tax=Belliella filtrata TaxID=2923435 RepID=A0ABS9V1R8_9BACT|nr:heme ABC transporter ATP-binding protein [Belliella filtrata]MCH7410293.1 heme ABC transporter ATP-binding protein [Belliella filtrata]
MLQGKNIHFCISERPIIGEVNIMVAPGELTAIIGPNGAGKSTLFKLLSGDLTCNRGEVSYNGKPLAGFKSNQLAKVRAVMPQHSEVSFPFSSWEIVALGMINDPAAISDRDIQAVMEKLQVWHLRAQAYNMLSGGEKQRVQLARVLVQVWKKQAFPRFILLDEPVSSMDVALQHLVLDFMNELKQRNIGILMVLHDLSLVANYADQVIMMKHGEVMANGHVSEVFTNQNLESLYGYPIHVEKHHEGLGLLVHSLPIHHINQRINKAL